MKIIEWKLPTLILQNKRRQKEREREKKGKWNTINKEKKDIQYVHMNISDYCYRLPAAAAIAVPAASTVKS